jgi:hypothetical protein
MEQAASPRDVAKVFRTTDLLLAGGFVGGALFIVVSLAQALTRSGYEFSHHPLSLLSLGDMGWFRSPTSCSPESSLLAARSGCDVSSLATAAALGGRAWWGFSA